MMKTMKYYLKNIFLAASCLWLFTACNDFLTLYPEDDIVDDEYWETGEDVQSVVASCYRFMLEDNVISRIIYWGEARSDNMDYSTSASTDEQYLKDANLLSSNGLVTWGDFYKVINICNKVIKSAPAVRDRDANFTEERLHNYLAEVYTLRALCYFYLVRSFGAVPIIHDNTDELNSGNYNSKFKVEAADVYEYIIMTLEKAMELLPARGETGRIDRYCAEGLLAKVYLTKSGLSGTRNADDLAKAAEYSKDVINNSGRNLLANYSDVFRLANNKNEECLFSWHWSAGRDPWTQQNTLQSDLAMVGFDEFGDCWGGYAGPSVDLQDAFGISALESPETRSDTDTRRKATMMMAGDVYDYFWQDKGGFDYLRFIYDAEYGKGGPNGDYQSPTGANHVKHLYGNNNDHVLGLGVSAGNMYSGLATHILRLSDIYLVYAEAKMGLATSTTDQSALDAFNAVRGRAIPGVTPKTSITWEDVWKERRLELACEGDRWYDYVRLAYYDSQRAINELKAQRRDVYYSLGTTYKAYYENGSWTVNPDETRYNPDAKAPNVTVSSFTLPFPTEDVVFNPNLMKDPVHVDVRSEFSY